MARNPDLPHELAARPRVAVRSDDPLVRAGLERLLGDDGLETVGPEDDAADAVLWDPGPGDDAVLDRLGEIEAIDAAVVALLPGASHAAAAIAAGARGVLVRDRIGPGVASAVRAVACGLTVLDTDLADTLLPAPRPRRGAIDELTARERQVVDLMSRGLSNRGIADALGISEHTAKFHVNGVLAKLGAATRTEAVVEALRLGLVML
jgi:DNA-binding NarL/FixJ family response regulator